MALAVEGGELLTPTPLVDKVAMPLVVVEPVVVDLTANEAEAKAWVSWLIESDASKPLGEPIVGVPAAVREEWSQNQVAAS